MRLRGSLLLMLTLVAGIALAAARLARPTPTKAQAERSAAQDATAYTLPPEKMQKAVALERTRGVLEIGGTVWSVVQLALLLALGVASRMRNLAVGLSRNRWVQGFAFVLCLLVVMGLLDLPLAIYGHTVSLRYGLSVQGWGGWLADKGKWLGIEWVLGGLLAMLMFWVIRRSPERWWFWFWIPAVVVSVAGVFAMPYVIDPLFNQFEPLATSNPALVARLEQVVARGGLAIPPERMFVMKASAKSTTLNAYVTGFGASKRVVVWDNTITKASPDEISFIFAHEMGHYALGHVLLGTVVSCIGLLPLFWLGYHGVRLLLARYGAAWGIPSQQDWGALVVLLLVLTTISALTDPIANGCSRIIEHNADVYGQEAMHGIVDDPQQAARAAFQVLGEDSFDDPTPHPVLEWWFDGHPSIRYRAAFAEAYDPWAAGQRPRYFAR